MTENTTSSSDECQWQQPYATLCEVFESSAQRYGNQVFIRGEGIQLTYAQAYAVVDHLSNVWRDQVAEREVAVVLPNSAAFLVAYLALLRAGAMPALINVGLPPDAVSRLLADLQPARVIALEPNDEHDSIILDDPMVQALRDDLAPLPVSASNAAGDQICAILFSGGTTGLPKRIRHRHTAIMAKVERMEWGWPTRENEIWLPVAPFTHVYGYLMGVANPMLKGGTVVIPSRFHPDLIVELIEKEKVSVFGGGPPTIYQALLSAQCFDRSRLASLRVCPGGGASFPEALLNQWRDKTGLSIYEGIGMTEIAPIAVNTQHSGARAGTVGKPCPDTVVEIVDLESGTMHLPPGRVGEIRVKGPHMMLEYDRQPEETAHTLKDGFIYTGDIGVLDEDGFLRVTDRKKDVIFYKGYNVFPREIEEVLMEHPSVLQAAVVGRSDERAGEAPVAFIRAADAISGSTTSQSEHGNRATLETGGKQMHTDSEALKATLLAHCQGLLVDYKVPRQISIVQDMPLTAARKVDRATLREWAKNL